MEQDAIKSDKYYAAAGVREVQIQISNFFPSSNLCKQGKDHWGLQIPVVLDRSFTSRTALLNLSMILSQFLEYYK